MKKQIRIGNGAGFWGDQLDAPLRLVKDGNLDYLTLEYLAELTMGILASQKARDPSRGYVTDFITVLKSLIPYLKENPGLKIITNAGGVNIQGCVEAAAKLLAEEGLTDMHIAACGGDDVMPELTRSKSLLESSVNIESGETLASYDELPLCANAYLGADAIVDALKGGARIVITGRVADASLTLGPCVYEFGWPMENYNLLAGGTAAGHLIECGAQVTGGNWTNGTTMSSEQMINMGYPIAEMYPDGNFTLTKPERSGGVVNVETVSEQLLYEIGDPTCYKTPDVCVDFTTVKLTQKGPDQVFVEGTTGKAAPLEYKVSSSFQKGYVASGQLCISGPGAVEKAKWCQDVILGHLKAIGVELAKTYAEYLGSGSLVPGFSQDSDEIVFKLSAWDTSPQKLNRFLREFSPLVTAGPQGVTGYTGPRGKPIPHMEYFPFLISKDLLTPTFTVKKGEAWL